ncbi:MAG: VOC family protein [Jatrophihabitantaceae bacterium]
MTVRDTPWPAGTPCWVDLMTSDLDAARLFYEGLFGWHLGESAPDTGGYVMAFVDGKAVAGLGPMMQENHPPVWTAYLASDDADASTAAITAAGGTVLAPAFDVLDAGRMAVAQDPTGGTFGIWQSRAHTGMQLANEPNAVTWNEFMTRDYTAAKTFFADVFGYTYTDMGDEGFQYSTIELGGATIGGLGALPADVPSQVPAHWRQYFQVDDADGAVNEVVRLGGSVLRPAADMPYGRHADVADPQGATFSVITPAPRG